MSDVKNDFKAAALAQFQSDAMQARLIRAELQAYCDFSVMLEQVESPIEAMFLAGLFAVNSFDDAVFWASGSQKYFGRSVDRTEICAQFEIENYRCDFAVLRNHRYGTVSRLIVECDGHDFHDRTKEQARRDKSRDRILMANGWRVLRFTGSELYHDAVACADELAQILENDGITDWRLANG